MKQPDFGGMGVKGFRLKLNLKIKKLVTGIPGTQTKIKFNKKYLP